MPEDLTATPSAVAWAMYQKYAVFFLSIVRKKTGSKMAHRSAGPRLQTGSSIALSIIFSQCTIAFIGNYWNAALQWRMQPESRSLRRTPGGDTVIHVAVQERQGWPSPDHSVWVFPYQKWVPCERISERLPRISENGRLPRLNGLRDIKRSSCWAHNRQYFIVAVLKGKQHDYSQPSRRYRIVIACLQSMILSTKIFWRLWKTKAIATREKTTYFWDFLGMTGSAEIRSQHPYGHGSELRL